MTVKRKEMKLYADFKCNRFVCLGISSNSRMFHLFEDATTVDAPLTYCSHSTISQLYFIFVKKNYLVLFSFKYTFFSKLLICCIFYKVGQLEQYYRARFYMASRLYFETQSPIPVNVLSALYVYNFFFHFWIIIFLKDEKKCTSVIR